jgi:chemotaxis protein histidine kinase CheA
MSISLPLTLAILDGMTDRSGDEIYILPLGFVVESLQPAREDMHRNRRARAAAVRGEYLPVMPCTADVRHRAARASTGERHRRDRRVRRQGGLLSTNWSASSRWW